MKSMNEKVLKQLIKEVTTIDGVNFVEHETQYKAHQTVRSLVFKMEHPSQTSTALNEIDLNYSYDGYIISFKKNKGNLKIYY